MRKFKLRTGVSNPYEINAENFEKLTLKQEPYHKVGKDGVPRDFGVCPACDNPIQLIGLYKKLENTDRPYGKHYSRSLSFAPYNETAYRFCPYSSNSREVTKESRKKELTDYERNIYNAVRDYFDLAVYIIQQETGIYVGERMARRILEDYLSAEGHMYYWATLYNIPWMLLYFLRPRPCYGLEVKDGSALQIFLSEREDVCLTSGKHNGYVKVDKANKFLNLDFVSILHKRQVVSDKVKETLHFNVFLNNNIFPLKELFGLDLEINEFRFPALIQKTKYRKQWLIDLAKEVLPEI